MSEHVIHVSDDSFEKDVLQSPYPVLLDFWAPWCHPCKMIAPVLDELGKEYTGKIVVAKLDIDDNPLTPAKFGVRSIPTLMLFKGGNVEETLVGGNKTKSQLAAFVDTHL
jgi:thioredoxin 1